MKIKKYVKFLVIPAVVALVVFAGAYVMANNPADKGMSEKEALQIARDFVKQSPTFAFDGIEKTLQREETLYIDADDAWQFVFRFESRYAGYGDRTGQILAQVITPHEAIIIVKDGEVKSAIMDEKWDMVNQQMLDDEQAATAGLAVVNMVQGIGAVTPDNTDEHKLTYEVTLKNDNIAPVHIERIEPLPASDIAARVLDDALIVMVDGVIESGGWLTIEGAFRFDGSGLSKQDIRDMGHLITGFRVSIISVVEV